MGVARSGLLCALWASVCFQGFALMQVVTPALLARTASKSVFQLQASAPSTASKRESVTKTSTMVQTTSLGKTLVDMDRYNVPRDVALQEWTATMQAATATLEARTELSARSSETYFVDTLKTIVACPPPGEGLGVELLELAGGREDGLGITIVSGLVKGKVAETSGLICGDSIVQVSLRRRRTKDRSKDKDNNRIEEIVALSTECLDYDKTVECLLSALEASSAEPNVEQSLVFTVKRLRRKPKVKVELQYPPSQNEDNVTLELFAGENLRRAMLVRGVKLNDPLARCFDNGGSGDCGSEGTCATCAVAVQGSNGLSLLNPPSESEAQILAKKPRWRFGCRAVVGYGMQEGELVVRVNPRQWEAQEG